MSRFIDADAISAELRAMAKDEYFSMAGASYSTIFEKVAEAIDKMPTAQPERKKGRWLTSDDMYETGVCSACKCDSQEPVSYAITMFKYCPNCGAKMEDE